MVLHPHPFAAAAARTLAKDELRISADGGVLATGDGGLSERIRGCKAVEVEALKGLKELKEKGP